MKTDRGGYGRECIPDDQLPKLMNVIYNVWWSKWRPRAAVMDDEAWDEAIREACKILEQGDRFPIVKNLMMSFLYELEARAFGGYTDVTSWKVMTMLEALEEERNG